MCFKIIALASDSSEERKKGLGCNMDRNYNSSDRNSTKKTNVDQSHLVKEILRYVDSPVRPPYELRIVMNIVLKFHNIFILLYLFFII